MPDILQYIDITVLQPNPFQPRNKIKPEEVADLTGSIKRYGILEPLVIAQTPAGYQIIAGERRWRAAQIAGLKEVPVVIKKVSPREMLEMALIENVQRTDLNPLERAQALQQLQREFGLTSGQIAERINKSGPYVSNSLRLLTLPDAIKDGLAGNLISEGHARALVAIEDPKEMVEFYKELLKNQTSVRETEQLVRDWQVAKISDSLKKRKKGSGFTPVQDPGVKTWEEKFKRILAVRAANVKSNIRLSRSLRITRITITLKGKPEETEQAFNNFMDLARRSGAGRMASTDTKDEEKKD